MLEYRQVIPSVPLYRSEADSCALLWLPEQVPEEITLADAVQDTGLCASFLFFAAPPELSNQAAVQALYDRVSAELEAQKPCRRAILWHTGTDAYSLALNDAAAQTQSALEIPLAQGRRFRVARSAKLACQAEEGCLLFQNDSALSFVPEIKSVRSGGRILLAEGGAVCFDVYMEYAELLNSLSPGWEYRFPAGGGKDRSLSFSLLRADGIGPSEVKFQARFDPCREEARTLTFAQLKGPQPMGSWFCQPTGHGMPLLPVLAAEREEHPGGLRFCPHTSAGFHPTEPFGDYFFPDGGSLLCGIQGTELLELPAGGRLRFVPGQPGYAPRFPAKALEIADFVSGLPETLLTAQSTAAWACAASSGTAYCSQPDGAPLFSGGGTLLAHKKAPVALPAPSAVFPLVPAAGLDVRAGCALECAADFERQITAPVRQAALLEGAAANAADGACTAVTPAGQIVELAGDGRWSGVRLAHTAEGPLWFEQPDAMLVKAFQTGSLFLVVADAAHLGAFTAAEEASGKPAFHNCAAMDGWHIRLPVGKGSRWDDYRCIMLVKGRAGALYDPEGDGGLIADPSRWSCRDAFSSPVTDGKRDPAQQTNLSRWLVRYFADCTAKTGDPYTASFNSLARDPNWQGVLFLNVPLEKEDLPEDLACMAFGMPEGEGLFLHHLGIRLSPVTAGRSGPEQQGESALFGLVNYRVSGYTGEAIPLRQEDGCFRTLSLRVLFENCAVRQMESAVQLRLDRVLGLAPGDGSAPCRSLILTGARQARDGGGACALRCENETVFRFAEGPLEQVTVASATMQTLSMAADRYRFELSGWMRFRELENEAGKKRDLYSFASLPFSALALELEAGEEKRQELSERLEGLRLDQAHCQTRRGSMAEALALTLESAASGTDKPAGYAFLPFTGVRLSSSVKNWHGLSCRAALGSLGDLGNGAGISCKLLLAWDGSGTPLLWMEMPNVLELERVLTLSAGDARMAYDDENQAYLLTLPDVCLKCLGALRLPSSGTLCAYLFGGKGASEKGLGWYAMYQKEVGN